MNFRKSASIQSPLDAIKRITKCNELSTFERNIAKWDTTTIFT